ncbi:hypothetical protein DEI84_03010 [Curtobacterium sp. MCBD17_023]|nr:hypothetical protein DEI84_03010 [Curtobacterium sp. MCBD17_023]
MDALVRTVVVIVALGPHLERARTGRTVASSGSTVIGTVVPVRRFSAPDDDRARPVRPVRGGTGIDEHLQRPLRRVPVVVVRPDADQSDTGGEQAVEVRVLVGGSVVRDLDDVHRGQGLRWGRPQEPPLRVLPQVPEQQRRRAPRATPARCRVDP